jgi:sterol desaturase/sphingolipid hydroxylase (fatty acid hydroxylase superfamily)
MKMSKLGYFSEFLLFPPLVLIAALLSFGGHVPARPLLCALAYAGGLVGWTLVEYVLHRVLFHHAPILSQIHECHHDSPNELIGTPAWASVWIGVAAFAAPCWVLLGFDLGTAATAGLVTGYLWYVFVHYATHHWRPRRNSYLYRARMRHARHHHLSHAGNFGVTTGIWDHVFGTALEDSVAKLGNA